MIRLINYSDLTGMDQILFKIVSEPLQKRTDGRVTVL